MRMELCIPHLAPTRQPLFSAPPQALQDPLPGADSLSQGLAAFGAGLPAALRGLLVPEPRRARPPPRVEAWVGGPPRSFPLQLKHAGRWGEGEETLSFKGRREAARTGEMGAEGQGRGGGDGGGGGGHARPLFKPGWGSPHCNPPPCRNLLLNSLLGWL